eukprot:961505-Pelagomonas_calceolata.AAC.1
MLKQGSFWHMSSTSLVPFLKEKELVLQRGIHHLFSPAPYPRAVKAYSTNPYPSPHAHMPTRAHVHSNTYTHAPQGAAHPCCARWTASSRQAHTGCMFAWPCAAAKLLEAPYAAAASPALSAWA